MQFGVDGMMVTVTQPSDTTPHTVADKQTCLICKTLSDIRDHRSSASVAAKQG